MRSDSWEHIDDVVKWLKGLRDEAIKTRSKIDGKFPSAYAIAKELLLGMGDDLDEEIKALLDIKTRYEKSKTVEGS